MEDPVRAEAVSEKYTDDENSDAFSEFQGAILWPRRSLLYRVSFLAIVPLFAIFLMGFTSPFWMKMHQVNKHRGYYNIEEKVDVSIGLWRVCEGTDYTDITDCTVIPDDTPYFVACQTMMCLSLIFIVFSLVFGLYENCATRYDMEEGNEVRTKRPEMNAVMAGLCGLTGVCMYGASIIEAARNDEGAVHWAFPVTAASVTGVIVCGILMATSNTIHTATPSFPGQIMSLSRQNSLRVRESNLQDRLVIASDSVIQTSGAQASGNMYGVMGGTLEDRTVSFLKRSESCLSSHMSSPDIFTATSQDPSFSHSNRSTYVVEPHDIHARAYDHARRQALKQQLHNKAAQRRSWHFDDRNGAYIVTDLINTNTNDSPLSESLRDISEERPPVPPRRDKPSNSKRLSVTESVLSMQQETSDLMLVDDPLVAAPGNSKSLTRADVSVVKRNTNPFLEDTATDTSQSDLQHSTLSNSSWDSQTWPDPPAECEIIGQTAPQVPTKNNPVSDRSASSPLALQLNSVPESLQYQPQNYTSHPRKPEATDASKIGYNTLKSKDSHSKHKRNPSDLPHRQNRNGAGKSTPPLEAQVPIMQEYDNPLFKSQPTDGDRLLTLGENFSLQICESTSFVHPSPEQPPPSSFYTAVSIHQSDTSSYRPHSSHQSCAPAVEGSDGPKQSSPRSTQDKNRDTAPPAYSRFNNRKVEDSHKKQSSYKDKSKPSNKQHQNGIVKSRPRQVKREHQQRRNGHPDGGSPQLPPSPHAGLYGSSPNLTSKSPRLARRRPDSVGPGNEVVYIQSDCNRSMSVRTKTPEHTSGPYGYSINRQPQTQYYTTQPGQYRHWGDSDL